MQIVSLDFSKGICEEAIKDVKTENVFNELQVLENSQRRKAIFDFDIKKPYVVKVKENLYRFVIEEKNDFYNSAKNKAVKKYEKNN
jgi:hypothetical protein